MTDTIGSIERVKGLKPCAGLSEGETCELDWYVAGQEAIAGLGSICMAEGMEAANEARVICTGRDGNGKCPQAMLSPNWSNITHAFKR